MKIRTTMMCLVGSFVVVGCGRKSPSERPTGGGPWSLAALLPILALLVMRRHPSTRLRLARDPESQEAPFAGAGK